MNKLNRDDGTLDQLYGAAWSRHDDGPEPSAADFLAEHPDASPAERFDVLLTDQLLRWRCGRPRPIAEYLAEHPSQADDPEAILKLVQGEFLARLECGEAPDPESYARMVPGLAEAIRHQCEVDQWLTMPLPAGQSSMATTVDYQGGDGAGRADDGATDDGSRPTPESGRPVDLDAPLAEADFQLVRPLGAGGMGEVYEAVQKSLRKRVALKLIRREALDSPSRVRRFFAEARALARLRHPHIVGVHGIGRMSDGLYFLVMDLDDSRVRDPRGDRLIRPRRRAGRDRRRRDRACPFPRRDPPGPEAVQCAARRRRPAARDRLRPGQGLRRGRPG
jgi:hypothetical protein